MDLYALLGVKPEASADEIKRAYRKLAVELHPDRNGDPAAAERLKDVTAAYRTLSSAVRRRRYDEERRRAAGLRRRWEGPPRKARGSDLRYRLVVPFETGVRGGTHAVEYPRQRTCGACGGTGAEGTSFRSGGALPPCSDCDGAGRIVVGVGTRACTRCEGRGVAPLECCGSCGGRGRVEARESVEVTVPAGIGTGRRLRLTGYGDEGAGGGGPGDLFVLVTVADHGLLRLAGSDVECDVPVGWAQAMIGTEVPVPTVDGVREVRIPPGTQDGAVIRLPGLGAPIAASRGRGDQLVHVEVVLPGSLGVAEREALEAFARVHPPESEPAIRDYLAAVARIAASQRKG